MLTLNKIIELMGKNDCDNQKLASALGLNRQVVTDWKAGRSKSYKKYLPQIADHFGVSVDYLLGKDDKKENSIQENGTISIRSRDGSVIETELSDDQIELFKNMLKQFKGNSISK